MSSNMAAACGALWEAEGLYAGLTTQQVGGGVRGAVGVDQLPVEVVLLALAVLTRAGVRVLVKRAACSWRERGQQSDRATHRSAPGTVPSKPQRTHILTAHTVIPAQSYPCVCECVCTLSILTYTFTHTHMHTNPSLHINTNTHMQK